MSQFKCFWFARSTPWCKLSRKSRVYLPSRNSFFLFSFSFSEQPKEKQPSYGGKKTAGEDTVFLSRGPKLGHKGWQILNHSVGRITMNSAPLLTLGQNWVSFGRDVGTTSGIMWANIGPTLSIGPLGKTDLFAPFKSTLPVMGQVLG